MIGIIDYGMGNLRSVQKALQAVDHSGSQITILHTADQISEADRLVLPGVGAFADGMKHLREGGWIEPIKAFIQTGKPFLGICLGMQLLFDRSEEIPEGVGASAANGLGIVGGEVLAFEGDQFGHGKLKIPHMGWNTLDPVGSPPLLEGLNKQPSVYFVHGYYCQPTDKSIVTSWTDYGQPFCSSLHQRNVWASQFHPEKSQTVGLQMLRNFASCPH